MPPRLAVSTSRTSSSLSVTVFRRCAALTCPPPSALAHAHTHHTALGHFCGGNGKSNPTAVSTYRELREIFQYVVTPTCVSKFIEDTTTRMTKRRVEGSRARALGKRTIWSGEDLKLLHVHAPDIKTLMKLLPGKSHASIACKWRREQDRMNPGRKKRSRGSSSHHQARSDRCRREQEALSNGPPRVEANGGMTLVRNLVERAVSKVLQSAKARDYARAYQKANLSERNERKKKRRITDPMYGIKENLRSRLADYVRMQGNCKKDSTEKLLGCTWQEFKQHLQSTVKEEEISEKMETDHIFPMARHNLKTLDGQRRCMHFSNLQSLTEKENRWKKDRLPTKSMASRVERWAWPDGITEDMLPDIYDGWSTPLRM